MNIMDVNVSLGNWPFQRFSLDTPEKLVKHLKSEGISSALVSSVDAVLYPDPDVYNKLLIQRLKLYPNFYPVMVLNPILADWRQRLKEYSDSSKIKAIKILPNYHNYSLSEKFLDDLMNELREKKTALIIQMRIEDERNQYPLLKVAGVKVKEVIKLANRFPQVPIMDIERQ